MIPLWVEIVVASVTAAWGLYQTTRRIMRAQNDAHNRWRVHCHAADKGVWFYAVNGYWNGQFGDYYRKGGAQIVAGPIKADDVDAVADGRVKAEERVAILNAQKANYR